MKADEKKLVDDVEKYGCHIIHVREGERLPGWSYTIGLYQTFGQPEVLVVGLKPDTAQNLLNEVAAKFKSGLQMQEGLRQCDLLADVGCEFRKIENELLSRVVGCASWFYGRDEFPVYQCIYPDLHNRFPWEDSFDASWRSRQALLFRDATRPTLEGDFWSAHDPKSSQFDWKFKDCPHALVYTTKRIMNKEEAIAYVMHDAEDGGWQFHGPSESSLDSAVAVCFHHIVDNDLSITELHDLPEGWFAQRESAADPWNREPYSRRKAST